MSEADNNKYLDQKEIENSDTIERFEQVVCLFCDHTESSKQGNNVFTTDFYTGDFGTLGDQKPIDNPTVVFHHREEIECKCHCHTRYLD
jgi:hypothetical protein